MKRLLSSLTRFGLLGLLSFAINVGLTVALHDRAGLPEEAAFAIALAVVLVINFISCRYVVFGKAAGSARRQLVVYLVSSPIFRGLEYLAFLLLHTAMGVHYVAAILGILAVSFLGKFFFYRALFTRSNQPSAPDATAERSGVMRWVDIALVVLLAAVVFSNTLRNEMHLDSIYRVANNPEVERFWPPHRHFLDHRTSSSIEQIEAYRPLLPLSLTINNAISDAVGGNRLVGYHVGNIAIHVAASVLLYLFVCELLGSWSRVSGDRSRNIAMAASLLFAVHPVAGVPVNYICGRDLLLMMCFLVASLLVYSRMRSRGDSVLGWLGALFFLALSMLSKPNSVVAPLLVLLFELILVPGGARSWKTWLRPIPFALVVASFFLWTTYYLHFSDLSKLRPESMGVDLSLGEKVEQGWTYALTMARVHLFYYARNFVWAFHMRPLPALEMATGLGEWRVLAGAAFILATLVGAAMAWWRGARLLSWSILSYWVLLAPTSSIRPFRLLATDYRPYPSLAFLCIVLAVCIARLPKKVAAAVTLLLAIYFGASTVHNNRVWRTEESFWEQSVRLGGSSQAHMNYAKAVQATKPDVAEQYYVKAIHLQPRNVYAHLNLGLLWINRGRVDEGIARVERAVEISPTWALCRYWLGEAYRTVGRPEDALPQSVRAAELDPRNIRYQYAAGLTRQLQGFAVESLQNFDAVFAMNPNYLETGFLRGFALQQAGRWEDAEASYRSFLMDHPDHAQTIFNLAHGLMEHDQPREAIGLFEQVLTLRPENWSAHHWLAQCFTAVGDNESAAHHSAIYKANSQ